jgi:uncharacterized membrane protein YccC
MASALSIPALKDPVARSFAIRLTLASVLAMWLASMLSLTSPWWAAMAVWMVSQPTRGLLIERGLAQLLGTCVGGLVAVGLMVLLGATPLRLFLGLGVWIAVCCGAGNLMRHQRAYGAALCGLTTSVVVILCVGTDIAPADFAIARVLDGAIGILSSILLVALPNPRSQKDALLGSARGVIATTITFSARTLDERGALETQGLERRLLAEMASLDASAEDGAAGSVALRRRLKYLRGLLASLLDLISISRTVRMRIAHTSFSNEGQTRALGIALGQLALDIAADQPLSMAAVSTEIRRLQASDAALERPLAELDEALVSSLTDYREMSSTGSQVPTGIALFHPDLAGARVAMLRGAIAAFIGGVVWHFSGWEPARYLMLGACVFTSLFASADEPVMIVRRIFLGAVGGCLMAMVWRLGVLQVLQDEYLSLLLAVPFMFVAGLYQAGRATSLMGLAFNMIFAVLGQPTRTGVTLPGHLLMTELALLVGIALSYASYRWIMPMNTARRRDNLKHAILTEIAGMAFHAGGAKVLPHWARLRFLALGLAARAGAKVDTADGVLAALSVGHALLRISDILARTPQEVGEPVAVTLKSLRQAGRSSLEMSASLQAAATKMESLGLSRFEERGAELVRSLRDAAFCIAEYPSFFSTHQV